MTLPKKMKEVLKGCLNSERVLPKVDESRMADFLQALKQFSRLQHEAADAHIDARHKSGK
jgi:hypothetical protein